MMAFPISLLGEFIAVLPDEAKAQSGIVLPDWQTSHHGTGNARGNTRELKCEDRVVYGAATGMEAVVHGKQIRIMRESDVLAVIE